MTGSSFVSRTIDVQARAKDSPRERKSRSTASDPIHLVRARLLSVGFPQRQPQRNGAAAGNNDLRGDSMRMTRLFVAALGLLALAGQATAASVSKTQREAVVFVANLAQGSGLEAAFYNFVQFSAAQIAQTALGPLYDHVKVVQGNNATLANLHAALKGEADRGGAKAVDLIFVTHGLTDKVLFSDGKKPMSTVSAEIVSHLNATERGKLRIVFSTACFGATHRSAWISAGFKTASGSTGIYSDSATSYPAFLAAWIIEAKFSDAVAAANNVDPLRVSDNAARVWFNSQGKPDKANLVNSTRVISGNGALKINTM
jgi:hypothetical protein